MIIPKLMVEFSNNANGDNTSYPIQYISLYNNQIIIDDVPAETHFDGEHYHWQRINKNSQEEQGILKLFSHGLMGNGIISSQGSNMPFVAVGMVPYVITVDKETWLNFEMGFMKDEKGQKHAMGTFDIPDSPEKSKLFNEKTTTVFSIIQNEQKQDVLHVHFDVDPTYCSYGLSKWIGGDFNFTLDYSKFMGCVYEYDMTTNDNHGAKHDLTGSYIDAALITNLESAVQEYNSNQPPQESVLKSASTPSSQSLLKAQALATEIKNSNDSNSVEDLFSLPSPDMENLHQLSFQKLQSLMLYAIDDEWRNWFGEKKPDVGPNATLTQSDVALLDNADIKKFLKDVFAVGYLTQAFSQSNEDQIKKQFESIPSYKDKMSYFWKASGNHCFAVNKGYNLATSALMNSTFVSCVPGLSKYVFDNPVDWAGKLYEYCTTPVTLNGLALQNTQDGRKRLTHLCTILNSLDCEARLDADGGKKISYATSLYSRVMDVRFNFIIERFSLDNKEEGVEFLTEFYKQYFNSILAGGKWQDEVLKVAQTELKDLMEEYQVDHVDALIEKQADIIADSMEVFIKWKNLPLAAQINKWAKERPETSKNWGRSMTIGFYMFATYASINNFLGWSKLKPQEKVQAVINIVDVTANIFNDSVKFAAASKLANAQAATVEVMQANGVIRDAIDLQRVTTIADRLSLARNVQLATLPAPALGQGGAAVGRQLVEAESLEKTADRWARFSKVTDAFAIGMTILALGAACVCTGFQIAKDFSTGQPVAIKALDIIQQVANGVAFLVESGAGVVGLLGVEVCSVIPVIGVVAAVVGVVVTVVSMFIHKKQPPTPQEQFITDHSKPFIDGLDTPPPEWIELQKKIANHLETGGNQMSAPA
jgi:hypothetical protein